MRDEITAVVFDLDGTLVDSYEAITAALNAAREAFDLPPVTSDVVRPQVGHGLEELIARHLGASRVARGVEVFRRTYRKVMLDLTRPLPGVPGEVRRLAEAGLALGVASNKPRRFVEPILGHVGLSNVIRTARGPDGDLPPKPHPAMIRAVLADLGVPPAGALYVGDMPLDAESGRRAGCRTWLVATGSADLRELQALDGVRIFSDLYDLVPEILRTRLPRTAG